ncbi:ADR419Cp [Eremothecium gossypii ATCC 10895]|uniref:ADR419Cp n=1 Tax=Eremothecium gossypii (strain ATCC 10895 / CBS 109.51 / FGSC 9923 / NRRL Y-1056) TaxID=284811 RepID=Q758V9_EREGS|nr:ADR419Cp [Eremothecium gossypii ATCC 10895]AAS52338.1 ADR419Cp [Eremothecium gossypii ATCC 10895]AEY96635.1 FADR419Cp [Eremothecium gossypii FDAG1]
MAKKISKHSRAARRNEVAEPEARSLATLPRAEKTDITSTLIRTAGKNEALLEAKMNKQRSKKQRVTKKSSKEAAMSIDKERLERALNFTSRLDGKRQKSITRAKYVQSARKAGWDATNTMIRKELGDLKDLSPGQEGEDKDAMEEEREPEEEPEQTLDAVTEAPNIFSSLADDVEA